MIVEEDCPEDLDYVLLNAIPLTFEEQPASSFTITTEDKWDYTLPPILEATVAIESSEYANCFTIPTEGAIVSTSASTNGPVDFDSSNS